MGPSAFELPIFVLARVEPRTLLSERLVARKLVRCNTDGDRVADDAQDHMFVRRTVAGRAKKKYPKARFLAGGRPGRTAATANCESANCENDTKQAASQQPDF